MLPILVKPWPFEESQLERCSWEGFHHLLPEPMQVLVITWVQVIRSPTDGELVTQQRNLSQCVYVPIHTCGVYLCRRSIY